MGAYPSHSTLCELPVAAVYNGWCCSLLTIDPLAVNTLYGVVCVWGELGPIVGRSVSVRVSSIV